MSSSLSVDSSDWVIPPEDLSLSEGEVHIWKFLLNQSDTLSHNLFRYLAADERVRSDQFRYPELRERYISGRGLLRLITGRYLNKHPRSLAFTYGSNGKPMLEGEISQTLSFNQSHSHYLITFAFICYGPVGIDVEYLHTVPRVERLAQRFYSQGEYEHIRSLEPEKQESAFLRAWTRKEAYLKATGDGLIFPLSQVEVSLGENDVPRLLKVPGGQESTWCLEAFQPEPGYIGAVVYPAPEKKMRYFNITTNSAWFHAWSNSYSLVNDLLDTGERERIDY